MIPHAASYDLGARLANEARTSHSQVNAPIRALLAPPRGEVINDMSEEVRPPAQAKFWVVVDRISHLVGQLAKAAAIVVSVLKGVGPT
jgi:hypothetical protein